LFQNSAIGEHRRRRLFDANWSARSRNVPENPEPVFGGVAVAPPPEVFEEARRRNPVWYQGMERAYEEFAARPENVGIYPDPKGRGATVQQAWLVWAWIAGIESYCLLVRPLPPASTQRITRLVNCTAARLIDTFKSIQAAEGKLGVQLLYHDGRIGHSIMIAAYDGARGRFIYHDPWPERSLLVKENNAAGVDAEHEEGKLWSVTAQELERVAFAAFVVPHQWARAEPCAARLYRVSLNKTA
jgi:hypothetical protein